jgi:predicted nucleotidyltransferase
MSLQHLRKEIQELKNSLITQYEPLCKVFIFRENGFTDARETEEDLKAYAAAHPHTHVLKLIRKSCRKAY